MSSAKATSLGIWTSGALAEALGADLLGAPDVAIERLDTLTGADGRTLSFIRDAKHAERWAGSAAGAALISRAVATPEVDPSPRALLIVDDADLSLARLLSLFAPEHAGPVASPGGATIDASAEVDPDATLGAGVVIGPRSRIGAGATLHANVSIGADVEIGAGCDVRAGVVIEDRSRLGRGVTVHPNSVIGADGFGYRPERGEDGAIRLTKIPHAGHVEIGDDVEIGACTSIDRGKFGATRIGAGTKIDNLVQIGHNCEIGRGCIICGASGIAGSVTIGDGVTIAGGAGLKDNITIADGATIAARSNVMNDIPAGETWAGSPAMPAGETMRIIAAMRRLPAALKTIRNGREGASEL